MCFANIQPSFSATFLQTLRQSSNGWSFSVKKEVEKIIIHSKSTIRVIEEIMNNQKTIRAQAEEKTINLIRHLPTKENFSNLIQSYLKILQKPTDIIAQDEVCKKVVSNLYVKNDFVSVINLNPPYDSMVDFAKISTGWG